ncbi:MAG TPA: GNAT family N-acetyltransferase [Gemmataceae bacterium]|nr:GNAT family N-acetyltransferase [Gemmataceae bacterium]
MNATCWHIRQARPADAEAMLELWRSASATPSVTDSMPDIEREVATDSALVLLAEIDRRLAGSIIGTFDGWRAHVYRLAVHPDYRRRGLASALLAELEKWFVRQGARHINPLVEKDHPDAMGFWQAAGYVYDPRIVRHFKNL